MLKFRIIFFAKWLSVFCLDRNYYDQSYFLQVYHISATWVLFCICYLLLALDSSVKRLGGQVREPMPRIQSDVVSQMADWSWSSHLER